MNDTAKSIEKLWGDMKAQRTPLESQWKLLRDYFAPFKTIELDGIPGENIKRRIRSSVAVSALTRYAARLVGYMIDQTQPFLLPWVDQGRATASRRIDLSDESKDYLDELGWTLYDWQMNPQSNFLSALSRAAFDLGIFGSAVIWTGHRRGFGPVYHTRAMRACWFDVNEDDQTDKLAFEYNLPLWKLYTQYPEMSSHKAFANCDVEKEPQKPIKLLHMVKPRAYGKAGDFANRLPFADIVVAPDHDYVILSESGFEAFPFSVPRINPIDNGAYARGPASLALPAAIEAARLQDYMSYGFGRMAAPPEMAPYRFFKNAPRRDPGSMTYYEPRALGLQNIRDAVFSLPYDGDPGAGMAHLSNLHDQINAPFELEFSKLRDAGNVSAEEVRYRKQLDMVNQVGVMATVDRDLFTPLADRSLDIFAKEGILAPPPEEISGAEVRWDYKGPLRAAHQEPTVQAYERLIGLANMAAGVDPGAVHVIAVEEGLRIVAESLGAPQAMVRARVEVKKRQEADAAVAQEQQEMQAMQMEAGAARDLGQAVASVGGIEGEAA